MTKLEDRINSFSEYYKKKYKNKTYKIGLSIGQECPQRIIHSPCIFCLPQSFIDQKSKHLPTITNQIDFLTSKLKKQYGDISFIAYFQDNTSTFGDIDYLKNVFDQAFYHPLIKEVIISTRPDYINRDVLNLFKSYEKDLKFEIGMQTIHDKSLLFLNRNHTQKDTDAAIKLIKQYKYMIGVHLLLGIPHESIGDILQTIEYVNAHNINEVKIHNLIAYKNTRYGELYKSKNLPFAYSNLSEYCELLIRIIGHLNPSIVISRLFTSNLNRQGNALNQFPGVKTEWINHLTKMLNNNNVFQGCLINN
ncbi:MAG: TIGR01212 family radical SAM protein [Candidatus Cloacimonadales bacterium]|jgi:radical SAM protein (TIGR01212 family)|nr:TIGR01212 family radical SAM protein [Candidatus Cloacimonadota bacterium]MDD2650637.1 TIGR01212 family radical SAM protein [Candidatus Cloacimonadota bacterium]MDD3501081.1 TIGR01212 family radical SAM protein [Candidatus Cloacimonadota bacterium]MDX9976440.1 TIGR01212 family radical SAM protein [Candidatus Cloacimonadales bacterium]